MLGQAVGQYRKARDAWSVLAKQAKGLYMNDVTYGGVKNMRGHWIDRLPAIDADIDVNQAEYYETAEMTGQGGCTGRQFRRNIQTPPSLSSTTSNCNTAPSWPPCTLASDPT